MAQLGQELQEKVKAYHDHYELCKDKSYESEVFKKHFEMADDLIRFIIEGYQQGALDAKDIHQTDLHLDNLFRGTKDQALKQEALEALDKIKADIKRYLQG